MADNHEPGGTLAGIGAAGLVAACCGLPLLLGAGLAVGAVGVAVGSVAVVAGGAALAVWGWRQRRAAHRSGCGHDPSQRGGQRREAS